MSFGGGNKQSTAIPEIAGTDPEDTSTNQEAIPVPWLAGERKIALRWMCRVYNQFAKEAPQERPGKK